MPIASLCPPYAAKSVGTPAKTGSRSPSSVSVTDSGPTGSGQLRSMTAPWWKPSVPMP